MSGPQAVVSHEGLGGQGIWISDFGFEESNLAGVAQDLRADLHCRSVWR